MPAATKTMPREIPVTHRELPVEHFDHCGVAPARHSDTASLSRMRSRRPGGLGQVDAIIAFFAMTQSNAPRNAY